MAKTFLQRDGKLLLKNGRFVVTENPADCDCCEAPCGASASSGGQGVTVNEYGMPSREGDVDFTYNSYGIPDSYKIESLDGQVFIDTGDVSGQKTLTFRKPQGVKKVRVTVTGPSGTAWQYFLGCPKAEPASRDNPLP
jgi:hypothetical protein